MYFALPAEIINATAFSNRRAPFSLISVTHTVCRLFDIASLRDEIFSDEARVRCLFNELSKEVFRLQEAVKRISQKSATAKIAHLLLTLRDRLELLGLVEGCRFEFPLRQIHLADATGMTTVHVSRVLASLREQGLIKIANRHLTIVRPQA
jgi:CRP/FNR family transcriptional regulator